MKNFIIAGIVVILVAAVYFSRSYWMPDPTPNDPIASCITITTPTANTTVSFPLTIAGTVDYACWTIFEAQAGYAIIQQNNQAISAIDINNGLIMVSGDYYQQANYPVSRSTIIQSVSGAVSGLAQIVLTPSSPCGNAPECPPLPAPVVLPITLP